MKTKDFLLENWFILSDIDINNQKTIRDEKGNFLYKTNVYYLEQEIDYFLKVIMRIATRGIRDSQKLKNKNFIDTLLELEEESILY